MRSRFHLSIENIYYEHLTNFSLQISDLNIQRCKAILQFVSQLWGEMEEAPFPDPLEKEKRTIVNLPNITNFLSEKWSKLNSDSRDLNLEIVTNLEKQQIH